MLANNETGVVMPIPEISRRIKALNQERAAAGLPPILVHTDAAQALGKRRVDVEDLGVDFLTIVGHKSSDIVKNRGTVSLSVGGSEQSPCCCFVTTGSTDCFYAEDSRDLQSLGMIESDEGNLRNYFGTVTAEVKHQAIGSHIPKGVVGSCTINSQSPIGLWGVRHGQCSTCHQPCTGPCPASVTAAELVTQNWEAYEAHMRDIRDYLEERLEAEFGQKRIHLNSRFPGTERLPNTCNFSIQGPRLQGDSPSPWSFHSVSTAPALPGFWVEPAPPITLPRA
ncbi:hypothetical protein P7K49_013343 [Saguinus oedipus]|uniref:Selenocysteine lyase n=1 Tax=Saguinus oedipus TaxID=9490 RepID=A0ABQ9VFR4_SAGOE|nr:hypothetical protein P7K49_013343 [Saguinus oedipus]